MQNWSNRNDLEKRGSKRSEGVGDREFCSDPVAVVSKSSIGFPSAPELDVDIRNVHVEKIGRSTGSARMA